MVVYFCDSPPGAGVLYSEDNTTVRISHVPAGCGTLYLTETAFCWFNTVQNRGLSIPWKNVMMHAITSTPEASIYLQVDFVFAWERGESHEQSGESDSEEEQNMTEMWVLPECKDNLNQIYQVMNECQAMNPDGDNDDDSGEDSDFVEEFQENGGGDIQHLSLNDPDDFDDDGQFEDAE